MVAPVIEKNQRYKSVYLPDGEWINIFTGERYIGGREMLCRLRLMIFPFVKSGSIIPRRAYSRAIELGSNEHIHLDIYAPGISSFDLIEDDGLSNDYLNGKFSTTTISQVSDQKRILVRISPISGSYIPDFKQRKWTVNVENVDYVKVVKLNGVECHEYDYDPQGRKIILEITRPLNEMTEIDVSK